MSSIDNIRNFAIIAHIDHGKSTIADRIIHSCGGLTEREMKAQVLDSMDIERERGITIKAQTVKLNYKAKNGKNYILNIIDTPGHVDFSYEVSRSLYACEGSILIVDSTQGVEAQTLANVYQALDTNHEIVPVLNKVDLPASDLDRTKKQIEEVIGIDTENAIPCSGKTGEGIDNILEKSKFNITSDNFALMSIDIDSYDYYVFNSIEKYFPKVLILEVSSGYLPARDHISESDGCSIKSAYELGIEKGYKMVCHCGNVIFVRDDLVNKLPDYDYSIENLYQTPDDLKKWEVGE